MKLSGALAALLLLTAACKDDARPSPQRTTTTEATSTRPVRIGVWMPPDPAANTYGGAAVRSLVYPQLFRATPQGKWVASLVERGSDRTAKHATSARFRIRRGAAWSDGTPITVSDLRRTLDGRFVTAVDEPTRTRTIVVHFSQPLPGWRRLWSGLEAISPPRDGVFGGPFRVEKVTPNFETVLTPNKAYWGERAHIAEVRLVLVPDADIQARLMEKGELDVIAPLAFTDRTARLQGIRDSDVLVGDAKRGGWLVGLVANPARLDLAHRMAALGMAKERADRFVDVLLHDEATGAGNGASPASPAPSGARASVTSPLESGPANLLVHAMQRAAHAAGRDFDLRQAEFDRVLGAYSSGAFDVLVRVEPQTPTVCWTCSYAPVDAQLAHDSDSGDRQATTALRRKLITEGLVLPLWRERPVAAVRDGLEGVSVNGFSAAGPAWNLEAWRWKN